MKTKIINGKIISENGIICGQVLAFESGKITFIGEDSAKAEDCAIIDAEGRYISPGFIDIHVHGGNGYDFMDGSTAAFDSITRFHAEHGTTSMLATTLTSSDSELFRVIDTANKWENGNGGAKIVGLYLEGPYFSRAQCGAQDKNFLRVPEREHYEKILGSTGKIKIWSIAPELDEGFKLGESCRERGIVCAAGHTDAMYDIINEAQKHNYSHFTHLYSAMNGFIRKNCYRYAGAIEAGLLADGMTAEIIADGCHLPVPLLRLIYKCKGKDGIVLVTDAISASGVSGVKGHIGSARENRSVLIENGVAFMPDKSSFAGSIATTDRLVRVMYRDAGIPLADVIKMITTNPAILAGIYGQTGSLCCGKQADIVIFDENIEINSVYISGENIKGI